MNMKQFKYVQVLDKEKSFLKASKALNISQPSLSQYIKKIESEIGVSLFERSGSNVYLTDAGRIYVESAKKILEIEHQMKSKFNDISKNKYGTITIGTSPFRAATLMPKVAKKFNSEFPGMHLIIKEMTVSELTEKTSDGEFDLSILMLPIDENQFNYEKLMEEELILAVPNEVNSLESTNIPNRKYPAISFKDISNLPFVTITNRQRMQTTFDDLLKMYDVNINEACVVKSIEAQTFMVKEGVGCAFLPSGITEFIGKNDVKLYSFIENLPKREIVAIWKKDRELSNASKRVLEIIKEINL